MAVLKLILAINAYLVFLILKKIYKISTSPIRKLPGPRSKSFLLGNIAEIRDADNAVLHEQWIEDYGPVMKYHSFFNDYRLYTTDLKAINHILTNTFTYEKPEMARTALASLLGTGLLFSEGELHRRQRRVMNPAFGPAHIRELTEIFIEKSLLLKKIWENEVAFHGGQARIDVLSTLGEATLDVIALAGFNYEMNALSEGEEKNELNELLTELLRAEEGFRVFQFAQLMIPGLRNLPTKRVREVRKARGMMVDIGKRLIHQAKAEKSTLNDNSVKRDLLSLLVKSNMSENVSEHQRLPDEYVIDQIPTFLVAGQETTSIATTYTLFCLAQYPEIQHKLRQELLTSPTDTPTMDELNGMPYLDQVLKETLRLYAPVPNTLRAATEDDVIPLDVPFTDETGEIHNCIHIKKGQTIFVPIIAINRSKSIWGADALDFKPDRWEKLPETVNNIPGLLHMMTFLGGPHACIGYRFSIVESKALLFTLVRSFEFDLAVPKDDIVRRSAMAVIKPMLRSDMTKNQLPLLLRPYNPSGFEESQ